jgi:hypothetical protein
MRLTLGIPERAQWWPVSASDLALHRRHLESRTGKALGFENGTPTRRSPALEVR